MKPPRPPHRSPSPDTEASGSSGHPPPDLSPEDVALRALVTTVKDKLLRGDDFAEVMDAIFEHLGTDLGLLERGERIDEQPLAGALVPMAEQMAGRRLRLMEMKLLQIREHGISHGLLYFVGWLGVVLVFDDIGMGILALGEAEMRGPTVYGRFKFVTMEPPPAEAPN
jgi:hypothetical protein